MTAPSIRSFIYTHHRLLFYGLWLLLGIFQAGLTELQDDEAYYWVFSKYLDFGYFDHPPMTALLIKMGYAIFPNELGVRLFPLLLNVLSLLIIEKLTERKNPFLFYAIALSLAILQISGFNAVPDIPLIFFTALFFLWYRRLCNNPSALNALLLGIAIAFLLYSKYHAVLIVLFTLLSNLRLFRRYHIYLAGIIAFLLFVPHLLWQMEHHWISFRYHLFESNVNAYKFSFTSEYFLGQIILAGPIAGFILLPAAFLYKTKTPTEGALRFTMIGIYLFFLLSSFRGKVEANWTSPAIVSLIVLSHQYLQEKFSWQKLLIKFLPITLFLVLAARIVMIEDIVPVKQIRNRFHAWKEWPAEMKKRTQGLPIVFSNSYQRASKYWFYSGQMTLSQNLYKERRNNYNFWPIEEEMIGKPVYFLDIYDLHRFPNFLKTPIGFVGYRYDSSFLSFQTIQMSLPSQKINSTDSLHVNWFTGRYLRSASSFLKKVNRPYKVYLVIFDGRRVVAEREVNVDLSKAMMKTHVPIVAYPGVPKGKYKMMFSIAVSGYNLTHNSEKKILIVE